MGGEIILVGDELLSGRVADLNARYIAAKLWPLGLEADRITYVADNIEQIKKALGETLGRASFVIVSGGLGTTDDDLTADAAAEYLGLPLLIDQAIMDYMRQRARATNRDLAPESYRMARIPQGGWSLTPSCAGFGLNSPQNQLMFFLPGVPAEFRNLVDTYVLPALTQRYLGINVQSCLLRTFGLWESQVGHALSGLADGIETASIGYYPELPEILVQLTVRNQEEGKAKDGLAALKAEVLKRLEGYVLTSDGSTLAEAVCHELKKKKMTLALAESCTGGLITSRLVQVPGISEVLDRGLVVYANRAKESLLGVSQETLFKYGAVSQACAREMAEGVRIKSGVDVGLSITGLAGPDGGSEEKPVGTVFMAVSGPAGLKEQKHFFRGSREYIRSLAAEAALVLLFHYIDELAG